MIQHNNKERILKNRLNDRFFKALFGVEGHEKYLISILNSFFESYDKGRSIVINKLTFLNRDGQPSICGGGRRVRIGRVEDRVEELFVLIDSSIVEVFVNGGETVFTTRVYLDKKDRNLAADGRCRILAI